MNTKQIQILCGTVLAISISSPNTFAKQDSSDWRPDYKAMVGAYYTNDFEEALNDAKTCLDKILALDNATEKSVALDELVKYLNNIGGRNVPQQNYSLKEQCLKLKLKIYEAKYADNPANDYQTKQTKKELAICLVLEGKSKEAETYLNTEDKSAKADNLSGWKKDIFLFTDANKNQFGNTSIDPNKLCEYATNTVNDISDIKNPTEKEVAVSHVKQQLNTAEYRFKNNRDYPHEEKILKLLLKIQEAPGTDDNLALGTNIYLGANAYSRTSTLKELVVCLVMQNKDDEASIYNKMYKEETEKMTKNQQKIMENALLQVKPVINKTEKSTETKE